MSSRFYTVYDVTDGHTDRQTASLRRGIGRAYTVSRDKNTVVYCCKVIDIRIALVGLRAWYYIIMFALGRFHWLHRRTLRNDKPCRGKSYLFAAWKLWTQCRKITVSKKAALLTIMCLCLCRTSLDKPHFRCHRYDNLPPPLLLSV